jgi:tRNA nucleotidyltransferase (CCA-adding enzyme)
VLNQAYQIRRNTAKIVAAEKASTLYHLLASTSDEARLLAWLALEDEAARTQIQRFQMELRDIAPVIDGDYLKQEFHLPPGPIYRVILDALREARLDGRVTNLVEEKALVEEILAKQPSDDT